jgi:hypothetical protein
MSILKELQNVAVDLSDRILNKPTFINNANSGYLLDDVVVAYNDGRNWKIIPLSIMTIYPFVHDVYYEEINSNNRIVESNAIDVTVMVCPYTLYSIVLFGKYKPINKIFNGNLIVDAIEDEQNMYIPILNNFYSKSNGDLVKNFVRKQEVKIMTLRNILTKYPDFLFIDSSKINIKKEKLVEPEYYVNYDLKYFTSKYNSSFHPKTLVYVIEYISKKTGGYKYTTIIPKKVSDNSISKFGYNIKKNGFDQYMNIVYDKIKEKGGIIYNCLWFAWDGSHPNSKIIKL